MNSKSFCYWLQGFMEVQNPKKLDKIQTQIIKDHLALVFDKQTPNRINEADETVNEIEDILNEMDNHENFEPQSGGIDAQDYHIALC